MKFKYEGYDRTAKLKGGTLEAESKSHAMDQLREMNLRPTKLRVISGGKSSNAESTSSASSGKAPKKAFEINELFYTF